MPDNTQNFNRYSYALNNPLKYTDPDGEIIFSLLSLLIPGAQPLFPAAAQLDLAWMQGGFNSKANGGSFWSGAGKGFVTGSMNAGLSFLNVLGIIPNGMLHAGGNVLTNGITNSMYQQDFFDGAGFQAITGFAGGAYSGYKLANADGLNYWWGNTNKYNRTSWSFYNIDKPDFVIDMNIPNVGSKATNDCVPTTSAELEAKTGGSRTYSDFTNDPNYIEGKGYFTTREGYREYMKKKFPNHHELFNDRSYLLFDPNYMTQAAQNGNAFSFHFGPNNAHADVVRKLQVFVNDPMKNRLIFRESRYNFSRSQGWNNIFSIFRIF
jgi:hypothetical protein